MEIGRLLEIMRLLSIVEDLLENISRSPQMKMNNPLNPIIQINVIQITRLRLIEGVF